MTIRFFGLLIILIGLLAACNNVEDESLPTLAQLPTETDSPASVSTLPPTWTATYTITPSITTSATITPTVTPSQTITDTPTATWTPEPPVTPPTRPVTNLVDLALQTTLLPQDFVLPDYEGVEITLPSEGGITPIVISGGVSTVSPAVNCSYFPSGGFATVFTSEATLSQQLGCPIGAPPTIASFTAASQIFERGLMIWIGEATPQIYVLEGLSGFQIYADTYNSRIDPESGGETPPPGLLEPLRGFGKVWRTFPTVKNGLGWAVKDEVGTQATIQAFDRGWMISLPHRSDILVLITNPDGRTGTWQAVVGQF